MEKPHILVILWNGPTMVGGLFSKALSKITKISTVGPSFSETESDFELSPGQRIQSVLDKLDSPPDVILCFYSKPDYFPPDLWSVEIPKAWYVYDTHLHMKELSTTAYLFDLVICTDEPTKTILIQSGIPHVTAIGFAADYDFYFREHDPHRKRKYQVGFAGSAYGHPQLEGRKKLLDQLAEKYDLKIEHRTLSGSAVADFYQDCQVVLNHAIRDDLNMRVPEALLSGRPLLTPLVTGFELQYKAGIHAQVYENHNIETQLNELLNNPEKAEKMAQAGQKWVLEHHTYDHKAKEMIVALHQLILDHKNNRLTPKNETLKQYAQFNYHRFRYTGDALLWLIHNWQAKNVVEKTLKLFLNFFTKALFSFCKFSKRAYFQNLSKD